MSKYRFTTCIFLLVAWLATFACTEKTDELDGANIHHSDLVTLFQEFREFQKQKTTEGAPDYSTSAVQTQYEGLKEYQNRLASIDPNSWSVSEQIDYHLVRAEMNGLEFRHRVLKPWAVDPGFYADLISRQLRIRGLPLASEDIAGVEQNFQSVSAIVKQAKEHLATLSEISGDLATLAILDLEGGLGSFDKRAANLKQHHPELASAVGSAKEAMTDYLNWIKSNQSKMTAPAGVGKENYNWLLKNVYLFPYTWKEVRTIVELEDNRVITFQRLEENRNRHLPKLKPAQSQAEYKQSVREALDHIINFLKVEEIFTMHDYLVPGDYFGSWHGFEDPWPEKHDYFFNFSHREPVMEETHEMVGHHFDELRSERHPHPIRGGRRPYKIATARHEGFAFALEELLMHAGYLDGRSRRAREIAYEQAAFRTVRALSDVYMHSGEWTLADAMKFCVENAPHGELLDGSHHLWFELATTLRGVGHHMLMVLGKVQFMKLFRDRANQLGDDFSLKVFMDEFFASGGIPMSLIRWEITGYEDEIEKLLE